MFGKNMGFIFLKISIQYQALLSHSNPLIYDDEHFTLAYVLKILFPSRLVRGVNGTGI